MKARALQMLAVTVVGLSALTLGFWVSMATFGRVHSQSAAPATPPVSAAAPAAQPATTPVPPPVPDGAQVPPQDPAGAPSLPTAAAPVGSEPPSGLSPLPGVVEAPIEPESATILPEPVMEGAVPDPSLAAPEGDGKIKGSTIGLDQEIQSMIEPFLYVGEGRRDPFLPFQNADVPAEGATAGPVLPLQRFDLKELRLIGIIWGVPKPKAMFIDPGNQVHVLEKDQRIGRNNGYLAVIREGEVVIVETAQIRGQLTYNTRVMPIDR